MNFDIIIIISSLSAQMRAEMVSFINQVEADGDEKYLANLCYEQSRAESSRAKQSGINAPSKCNTCLWVDFRQMSGPSSVSAWENCVLRYFVYLFRLCFFFVECCSFPLMLFKIHWISIFFAFRHEFYFIWIKFIDLISSAKHINEITKKTWWLLCVFNWLK